MKFTYDAEILQSMSLFEKVTHSELKDCLPFKDKIIFIVKEGELNFALGKNKMNILKLQKAFNKRFKVVEFSSNMPQFVVNLLAPLRVVDIKEVLDVITVTGPDEKTKGLMIGAKASNLREYESIVKRYYPDLKEIRVV